jgi:hypothetical protein
MMRLELKPYELAHPGGLEIAVEGFAGDIGAVQPVQLFLELYEGRLRVHVWTGDSESPSYTAEIKRLPAS